MGLSHLKKHPILPQISSTSEISIRMTRPIAWLRTGHQGAVVKFPVSYSEGPYLDSWSAGRLFSTRLFMDSPEPST